MSKTIKATVANLGFHLYDDGEGPLCFKMGFRLPDRSIVSSDLFYVGHNYQDRIANGSFSSQPARLVEGLMSVFEVPNYSAIIGHEAVLAVGDNGLVHGLCNPHGPDAWVDFNRIAELARADARHLVTRIDQSDLNGINGNAGPNVRGAEILSADFFASGHFELQARLLTTDQVVTTGKIELGGQRSTMVARLLHHTFAAIDTWGTWQNWSGINPGIAVELGPNDQIIRIGNQRRTWWCNVSLQMREATLENEVLCELGEAA